MSYCGTNCRRCFGLSCAAWQPSCSLPTRTCSWIAAHRIINSKSESFKKWSTGNNLPCLINISGSLSQNRTLRVKLAAFRAFNTIGLRAINPFDHTSRGLALGAEKPCSPSWLKQRIGGLLHHPGQMPWITVTLRAAICPLWHYFDIIHIRIFIRHIRANHFHWIRLIN